MRFMKYIGFSAQTLFAAQWCSIIAVRVRPPFQCLETRTDEESWSILGEEPASQVFLPLRQVTPVHSFPSVSASQLELFGQQSLHFGCDHSFRDEGEITDRTQGYQVH